MEGEKATVCVTGGTGYVASWLIMSLLNHGYSVHTTVRSHPDKKRDLSFLTSLPGTSNNLKIFNSDLNDPSTFAAPINGCSYVFHVASPMPVHFENEPDDVVIDKTVGGTLGILKICLNSKTVKRVVYTSSTSAVDFRDEIADQVDEDCWSDVDYIKSLNSFASGYWVSKTLTERAVLEFGEKYGLDVVSVVPSFVVGPFVCPNLPASVEVALALVFGKQDLYNMLINANMVHVDDLVSAHIFLIENPNARGRFICSSHVISLQELHNFLSTKYPELTLPTLESLQNINGRKAPILSSKKLIDHGFQYNYSIEDIFGGAIQCCKEKGYL